MDVVTRAEKWLTAHPTGPHFLWVHLYDPHDPYQPPAPYSRLYKDHLYDGEIAYADSALRNFLDYLRKRGWYEDAIIIVVGDHGESLGEHGEDTHGIFLYDATTHVPLIFKLRKNAYRGETIEAQVRTTDILPTVLDLLVVASSAKFEGQSLKPLFANTAPDDRVAFGETDYPMRFGWSPLRSVRTPTTKFIEAPRPELYDLRADASELHNNYTPWDKRAQTSRAMLAELRTKTQASVPSPATVPQETVDELKALGYLDRADVGSKTDVPEPSLLPDPKDKIQEANLLHAAMQASEDNRASDARAALEQVLQLDPKSPVALTQLGEIEVNAHEYARAAEHLKAARELRPNDAVVAFHEGQVLEKLSDFAGARDALDASLKLAPAQLRARLLLGQIYLKLENARAAQDQFEAAQLLDANNLQAQLGLARAEIAEGNAVSALDELKSLSESHGSSPEVFEALEEAYKKLGNEKQAKAAATRAKLLQQKRHQ
jgi:tetratricopeptide (TPR) repeat protein